MRNRSVGLTLFGGLAIIVAACGGGATPSPAASATPAASGSAAPSGSAGPSESAAASLRPLKVGVVTDVGQLEDKSFNEFSNAGAEAAAEETGGEHDVIVTRNISDYGANIQSFIDQDYDVIVTIGFLIGTDTAIAAKENPDIFFVGVDQGVCVDENGDPDATFACAGDAATLLPNYHGIVFAEAQPGYLAGIIAASLSESGTIGAVGGTNVPAVVNYWRGYENGAASVNDAIEVLYQETDPDPAKGFYDTAKGRAIGEQFIGQGADVLFQIAGETGLGVLEAACNADIHAIGVDVDQAVSVPNAAACIVTSAEKKLLDTVQAVVLSVAQDTFKAGTNLYDAASTPPAIGISDYHDKADLITPEIQALVDEALDAFTAGSLDPCSPKKCTVSGN
ncbi:MAG TPA: BMP family ABC transporter substrate-binding protein [Candidatus Limnocylindrales bacterium]|nr:BMP family ABC transporter substrate-binding protein [Candidatus Limnocylindrales bacterium]